MATGNIHSKNFTFTTTHNMNLPAFIDLLEILSHKNISITQAQILAHLATQSGCRAPLTDLASVCSVSTASITGQVDTLEKRGLLCRVPHPSDRRSIHAVLTPPGAALFMTLGIEIPGTLVAA